MINIYFTRHAESTFNVKEQYPSEFSFKDAELSANGKHQIETHCETLKAKMGQIDFVLCSPLTRCLQTAVLTNHRNDIPIYALSLLTEYCLTEDCDGSSVEELCSTFPNVNFEKYFFAANPDGDNNTWSTIPFRQNREKRVADFFNAIDCEEFRGKTLHVISHGGFIDRIVKHCVENYATFKVIYDTKEKKPTTSWRTMKELK